MAADRGAFGVRISPEKKGNSCGIPDLAGATAPARPDVDLPLLVMNYENIESSRLTCCLNANVLGCDNDYIYIAGIFLFCNILISLHVVLMNC
jgi:hypothetical protein